MGAEGRGVGVRFDNGLMKVTHARDFGGRQVSPDGWGVAFLCDQGNVVRGTAEIQSTLDFV